MNKPAEYVHMAPLGDDAACEIHDWPTEGLPRRLVTAMRAEHPKGVNACVPCIERATVEAKREIGAGEQVLCACQTCGVRALSTVNRYGWGDKCKVCGEDDLRQCGRPDG